MTQLPLQRHLPTLTSASGLTVASVILLFAHWQLLQPPPVTIDLDNPSTHASHFYNDAKPVAYRDSATGLAHLGSAPSMGKSIIALLLLVFC